MDLVRGLFRGKAIPAAGLLNLCLISARNYFICNINKAPAKYAFEAGKQIPFPSIQTTCLARQQLQGVLYHLLKARPHFVEQLFALNVFL